MRFASRPRYVKRCRVSLPIIPARHSQTDGLVFQGGNTPSVSERMTTFMNASSESLGRGGEGAFLAPLCRAGSSPSMATRLLPFLPGQGMEPSSPSKANKVEVDWESLEARISSFTEQVRPVVGCGAGGL